MAYTPVICDGGLDLITAPIAVTPGRLIACSNYEVAYQRGYRRMDGYELFDGGISPSTDNLFSVQIVADVAFLFTGGTPGYLTTPVPSINYNIVVVSASYNVGTNLTTVFCYFTQQYNLSQGDFQGFVGGTIVNGATTETIAIIYDNTIGVTNQDNLQYITALFGSYQSVSETVQPVPGQGNVNGLFWLNDQLYATRDMFTVSFTTVAQVGLNTPILQNGFYQGSSDVTATWRGFLGKIILNTGTSFLAGNAAGILMFYNTAGIFVNGNILTNAFPPGDLILNATTGPTAQAAALYLASGQRGLFDGVLTYEGQSWQWQDLGWNCQFNNGVSAMTGIQLGFENSGIGSQITATAFKPCGLFTNTGPPFLSVNGAATGALALATNDGDTSYVSYQLGNDNNVTQTYTLTDFGFTDTDIPPSSVITGFEIIVYRGANGAQAITNPVTDGYFGLIGLNPDHGNNFADLVTQWPSVLSGATTYTAKDYGGPTQLFGWLNVTPEAVKSTNFGLQFYAQSINPIGIGGVVDARVTQVIMRLWYLPPANSIYFWNGTSAVKANIVQAYTQNGSIADASAAGTMYFQFVQVDGSIGGLPARPIGNNEQIRTYPAPGIAPAGDTFVPATGVYTPSTATDGSTLLSLTSSVPDMNSMDWSSLLTNQLAQGTVTPPASKYQSILKNFYASAGLTAMYGVSGGGPAFYYDGVNFSRILTGLSQSLEKPRGIVAHQGHIILSYATGIVQWSDSANTLSFDPTTGNQDAGGQGFGERVTGLASINGDSLAVWTLSTIQMIQGTLDSGPYAAIISPTSGGIEYTIQPMANFMYADFRGITMVGATQKYGDFEVGHISAIVAPFLIPRLQSSAQFESLDISVINSVLIRNKNQYRLLFADGAVMTLTFLVDGEPPQFTIQNYTNNISNDELPPTYDPLTWDVVQAFTESTGRDRIFGATADGTGNVFELERGISFNTAPIIANLVMVPDHVAQNSQSTAWSNKMFRDIHIYGQAQDWALFTLARSGNYNPLNTTILNLIPEYFGFGTALPTGNITPFFSDSVLQIEGRAINIRIDSGFVAPVGTLPMFSHIIQAVEYDVTPLQPKVT